MIHLLNRRYVIPEFIASEPAPCHPYHRCLGARRCQVGGKGLVIRIFGRWPAPEDWVNIANLPLSGDWREQALRLLLPSAKDVQAQGDRAQNPREFR